MASEGTEGRLTNRQIVRLAHDITYRNMKSIAEGYMDIIHEAIQSLADAKRDDTEAFSREIIRMWMYRNPGRNQVQVRITILTYCCII